MTQNNGQQQPSQSSAFVATALCESGIPDAFISAWTTLLSTHSLTLKSTKLLSHSNVATDFFLDIPHNPTLLASLRKDILVLSRAHGVDVTVQVDNVFRKAKRLAIFDMDSTLIRQEVIDEIARHAGVVKDVAKITEAAMNGEIDFKESLRRRVGLLKGCPTSVLAQVRSEITFTEGVNDMCRALKKLGVKMAVISGGFIPVAIRVKTDLSLDYMYANQLGETADGKHLTGETIGPIVDGLRKAELLDALAQANHVTSKEQILAVGDGANDLWMLAAAGLGIAFNAKPKVQEQAQGRINQKSIRNVLYLLGYTDDDIALLTA